MAKQTKGKTLKQVEALKHDEASRKNIPTAEYQSLIEKEAQSPIQVFVPLPTCDSTPALGNPMKLVFLQFDSCRPGDL